MPSTQFTQDDRPIRVKTPLAKDTLLLETVIGAEELSRLYRFELSMLAREDDEVPFEKLLGQPVTVEIGEPDKPPDRYFNGMICAVSEGDQVQAEGGATRFVRYKADLVPKAWALTKKVQSRIFQQVSVPDILKQVLTGFEVTYKLQGKYEPRDYCVQYRESDFSFASRLMEEEGIYYFFEHADGKHTMVVADTRQSHPNLPAPVSVPFVAAGATGEVVLQWQRRQQIRSGKVTLWDYTFEMPEKNLESVQATVATVGVGTVTHSRTAGGAAELEVYDFVGGYAQRFDGVDPGGGKRAADLNKIMPDGKRTVGLRMQEEAVPGVTTEGTSDVRRFAPGYKFKLEKHPNANGDYVLTRVEHAADIEGSYTAGVAVAMVYRNRFTAIPAAVPFRPARLIPKPQITGPQSAVVVGPPGEEIFPDQYGRVKVQFRWDRQGKNDQNSSCWVRVSTPWAGPQWGMIHIPRIGHEVLVGFEDGDPDRPVILGSVYNAPNMPPYELSKFMTKATVKSRSTPKGGPDNFNELRFEDKKDAEEVYFHAERDFNRVVENNDTTKVGFEKKTDGDQTVHIFNNQSLFVGAGKTQAKDGSQSIDVFNNQTVTVGSGKGSAKDGSQTVTIWKNRTTTVETGNETLTVKMGNRLVEVSKGNDTHLVKMGNRDVQIDMGNDTLTIKMGNQTTKVSLGSSKTEAMQFIELKVGANSIKIDQSGITLKGILVKIEGSAMIQEKAPLVQINADGLLMLKGGVTMIN